MIEAIIVVILIGLLIIAAMTGWIEIIITNPIFKILAALLIIYLLSAGFETNNI